MILNLLAGVVLAVNGQTFTCAPTQVLDYINITASNVTVTDCHVRGIAGTNGVSVYGNSNILRRLLVERAGGTGVYFFAGNGHVIEDSVIRDPIRRQGWDSWGIYSNATGTVTIRRNLVWGSGFSMSNPSGRVVIEGNRFEIPPEYRTDCNGNIQRDGPCQCGEFGVALKPNAGSTIRNNTISGYRKSDAICGGSGTPGIGITLDACGPAERPCPSPRGVIEGNKIDNTTNGIYLGPGAPDARMEGNRICNSDYGISDGFGNPSSIIDNEFHGNVTNLNLYGNRNGPVSGNRITVEDCK